jgi:chorismate mutase
VNKKIIKLRKQIDKADKIISKQLIKRFKVVKQIGLIKKKNKIKVLDKKREQLVKQKVRGYVNKKLPKKSIENIYETIMKETKKIQK